MVARVAALSLGVGQCTAFKVSGGYVVEKQSLVQTKHSSLALGQGGFNDDSLGRQAIQVAVERIFGQEWEINLHGKPQINLRTSTFLISTFGPISRLVRIIELFCPNSICPVPEYVRTLSVKDESWKMIPSIGCVQFVRSTRTSTF